MSALRYLSALVTSHLFLTTDEGLAPAPHRLDCGLAPLSCRLPLKGGVMDGQDEGRVRMRNGGEMK